MALYRVVDNRDIDNTQQELLSSVVSLSAFIHLSDDFAHGETLHPMVLSALDGKTIQDLSTIYQSIQELHLSDLNNICTDVSTLVQDSIIHVALSDLLILSADIERRLQTIHIAEMPVLEQDVKDMIEAGGGGGGGSANITYKYWKGIDIPWHPGGGGETTRDITNAVVVLSEYSRTYQKGIPFEPTIVSVTLNGQVLTPNVDYIASSAGAVVDVGSYSYLISGQGQYTGTCRANYQIMQRSIVNEWTPTLEKNEYEYTGSPIEPNVFGLTAYQQNIDYTLQYKVNVNPGNAHVDVKGINNYKDIITLPFTITAPVSPDWNHLSNAIITLDSTEKTYTGALIEPLITKVQIRKTASEILTLEAETDYTIGYFDNLSAGTGHVTITAAPQQTTYKGSGTQNFIIKPAPISYNITPPTSTTVSWKVGQEIKAEITSPQGSGITPHIRYQIDGGGWTTTQQNIGGENATLKTYVVNYELSVNTNYEQATVERLVTLSGVTLTSPQLSIEPASYSLTSNSNPSQKYTTTTATVKSLYDSASKTMLLPSKLTTPLYSGNQPKFDFSYSGQISTAIATISCAPTDTQRYVIPGQTVTKNYNITCKYVPYKTYSLQCTAPDQGQLCVTHEDTFKRIIGTDTVTKTTTGDCVYFSAIQSTRYPYKFNNFTYQINGSSSPMIELTNSVSLKLTTTTGNSLTSNISFNPTLVTCNTTAVSCNSETKLTYSDLAMSSIRPINITSIQGTDLRLTNLELIPGILVEGAPLSNCQSINIPSVKQIFAPLWWSTGANGALTSLNISQNFSFDTNDGSVFAYLRNLKTIGQCQLTAATFIPVSAFYQCFDLVLVPRITGNITIGSKAFESCKSIREIHAESVTVDNIGEHAFYGMNQSSTSKLSCYFNSMKWNDVYEHLGTGSSRTGTPWGIASTNGNTLIYCQDNNGILKWYKSNDVKDT